MGLSQSLSASDSSKFSAGDAVTGSYIGLSSTLPSESPTLEEDVNQNASYKIGILTFTLQFGN